MINPGTMNVPYSNQMFCLKNYTSSTFYGVNVNGKLITVTPENLANPQYNMGGMMYGMGMMQESAEQDGNSPYGGIYVLTTANIQMMGGYPSTAPVDGTWYRTPTLGEPTYIDELNVLLFSTDKERFDVLEKYGDASKVIKSFAASSLSLLNGSYITITSLNQDKNYFAIDNRNVVEIPVEEPSYIKECCKKYGITEEMLQVNDIFIINRIFRTSGKFKSSKETVSSTEIKKIEKKNIRRKHPLIFTNNGLVLFDSKESADDFLDTYGNVSNYMIEIALDVTKHAHASDIEELNRRVKKDKKGMMETFSIMGGTSVASILTENLIKSSMGEESTPETAKKATKIFIIGAIGLATVYASYKLYRKYEEKRDRERAETARSQKRKQY